MSLGEVVAATPPGLLRAVGAGSAEVTAKGHAVFVSFPIACRCCGEKILALPAYYGEDGATEGRVAIACTSCDNVAKLFNYLEDGHDGLFAFCGQPETATRLADLETYQGPGVFRGIFRVEFAYNTELAQLEEHAASVGRPVSDLFDWFSILRGDELVWDWECG